MDSGIERAHTGGLTVHPALRAFVETEVLPPIGMEAARFWTGLKEIIRDLAPRHRELLAIRDDLQEKIDAYHRERRGKAHDPAQYEAFLREIGYIVPAPAPDAYAVATKNVDAEIGTLAGPQLVVPLTNARYALNAANARWGSLYDAFYGTNALDGTLPPDGGFDPARASRVVARVKTWLDQVAPLSEGSHADAGAYVIEKGKLLVTVGERQTGLRDSRQFAGFRGPRHAPESILLVNNGLHIELAIDPEHPIGMQDPAGLSDVVIEAALSTIMDLEDAVSAVDAADKVVAYRNWLQLMDGSLSADVTKSGKTFTRRLAEDRSFTTPGGASLTLPGRSTMLVRNVGHHMFTDAVLDENGDPVPEAILDAAITVASAVPDILGRNAVRNSRTGSVYVVKPKMHGPDEVGLSDALFKRIEELLDLPKYTMKIGVMDEERRTSVNLAACLSKVRDRTVLINTGFLDRTGDEIHTSMEAGAMVRKAEMKSSAWIRAYEANNVDVGIARNLPGRAQIGKGMWAAPDLLSALLKDKIGHPQAGASTAWVPTPTAATLHALHYHMVDVRAVQEALKGRRQDALAGLLSIPLADRTYTPQEIQAELDNNLQGLLGYVVRWIDQGVGCSTVPDLDGVRLMEDRATLRISSQHVANWLHHGIVSEAQVRETMRRMAEIVDQQNQATAGYLPMAPGFDGPAFKAAEDLVFTGRAQPNGYTEHILHERRREAKTLRAG